MKPVYKRENLDIEYWTSTKICYGLGKEMVLLKKNIYQKFILRHLTEKYQLPTSRKSNPKDTCSLEQGFFTLTPKYLNLPKKKSENNRLAPRIRSFSEEFIWCLSCQQSSRWARGNWSQVKGSNSSIGTYIYLRTQFARTQFAIITRNQGILIFVIDSFDQIAHAEFVEKEIIALYQLKRYRGMRSRYGAPNSYDIEVQRINQALLDGEYKN